MTYLLYITFISVFRNNVLYINYFILTTYFIYIDDKKSVWLHVNFFLIVDSYLRNL